MRVLLDTCVFLWLIGVPERLSPSARQVLEAGETEGAVSVVSFWEVIIKSRLGAIRLDTDGGSTVEFLSAQCARHRLDSLAIKASSLEPLERLPDLHRDPFDRLLICQAIEHGLALVTPDVAIRRYPVKTLW